MTMSQSTRSKSSTMIRRSPSAPFSRFVTLQEQDSRKPFSVRVNSSLSSKSRMLSVSPSRAVQDWEFIILKVSRVLWCDSNRQYLLHNRRREENDQLLLLLGLRPALEKFSQQRDVAQ